MEIKELQNKVRQASKRKLKAKNQLLSTITLFQSKVRSFDSHKLEAYMCVGKRGVSPSVVASDMHSKMQFGRVNTTLYLGTTKCFE